MVTPPSPLLYPNNPPPHSSLLFFCANESKNVFVRGVLRGSVCKRGRYVVLIDSTRSGLAAIWSFGVKSLAKWLLYLLNSWMWSISVVSSDIFHLSVPFVPLSTPPPRFRLIRLIRSMLQGVHEILCFLPELGCYWLYKKLPANRSDCTLALRW